MQPKTGTLNIFVQPCLGWRAIRRKIRWALLSIDISKWEKIGHCFYVSYQKYICWKTVYNNYIQLCSSLTRVRWWIRWHRFLKIGVCSSFVHGRQCSFSNSGSKDRATSFSIICSSNCTNRHVNLILSVNLSWIEKILIQMTYHWDRQQKNRWSWKYF